MGGAKISTKIGLIKNFLSLADNIVLGGALANTVLHAQGIAIGKSFFEKEMIEEVRNLNLTDTKLHIPVDTIVSNNEDSVGEIRTAPVGKTKENEFIFDIGPETEILFKNVIKGAKTIIWNGPMGLFEKKDFASGSEAVARAVAESEAYSIIGGGETICLIDGMGLLDKFSHVSTGGGAMLKFLAGEKLPGIEALGHDF
jgi:phosphoglycerate kinase